MEVTWVENGERYIKNVPRSQIILISPRQRLTMQNPFIYLILVFFIYLVVNGIITKYFELEESYNECLIDKKLSWTEFFLQRSVKGHPQFGM